MPELGNAEIEVMILLATNYQVQLLLEVRIKGWRAVLTPTQAASGTNSFNIDTMCLPLVTELSRLGLKASPEKSVVRLA